MNNGEIASWLFVYREDIYDIADDRSFDIDILPGQYTSIPQLESIIKFLTALYRLSLID